MNNNNRLFFLLTKKGESFKREEKRGHTAVQNEIPQNEKTTQPKKRIKTNQKQKRIKPQKRNISKTEKRSDSIDRCIPFDQSFRFRTNPHKPEPKLFFPKFSPISSTFVQSLQLFPTSANFPQSLHIFLNKPESGCFFMITLPSHHRHFFGSCR